MSSKENIRLTQTVQKGGCAAKLSVLDLKTILGQIDFPRRDECVIVDGSHFDDAALVRIASPQTLVQTLDFFTPIVDTPRTFGQIASANALSDVYAMGGSPLTAMAILAFPLATLPLEICTEVMRGCADILSQANTALVGGHTIDDDTLKFGLSVTGTVDEKKAWTNQKAQVGDKIILTKPLGTGAACAALKRSEVDEGQLQAEIASMTALNTMPPGFDMGCVHAATDVTGFGLAGHALNVALASQVALRFQFQSLPLFENTLQFIQKGFLTKAHRTNREFVNSELQISGLSDEQALVLFDPQTSGGLLLFVAEADVETALSQLRARFPMASVVGEVLPHEGPRLRIS